MLVGAGGRVGGIVSGPSLLESRSCFLLFLTVCGDNVHRLHAAIQLLKRDPT